MKSRRDLLRGAALTVATAALGAAPAIARASMPPAALVVVPDPLIKMARQLRRAEQRWNRACDQRDELEAAARDAGFTIGRPFMTVGCYACSSVREVRHWASDARFSPERTADLVGVYRRRLAHQRRQRAAAGLAPIDAKVRTAKAQYWRCFRAIAETPATTVEGLAVKVRLMASEIADGRTKYGERLARSALADARRLAAAGAA